MYLFNLYIEKKINNLKYNDNLIIFIQKLDQTKNFDNNFKTKNINTTLETTRKVIVTHAELSEFYFIFFKKNYC